MYVCMCVNLKKFVCYIFLAQNKVYLLYTFLNNNKNFSLFDILLKIHLANE